MLSITTFYQKSLSMNKLHFGLLIFMLVLASCASSNNTGTRSAKDITNPDEQSTTYQDLGDYLKRVPGLQVTRRGSSYSVLVRGMTSISGSSEPLYVIDKVRVGSYDQAAAMIDPNDIAKVTVLKEVASTSSYGMQGANGVILITSKK